MSDDGDLRNDAAADDTGTGVPSAETDGSDTGIGSVGSDAIPPDAETEEQPTETLVDPEERIAELEAQLAELNDQFLRKSADFENFRKRTQREKSEFAAYATRELLLDIVTIIDDFERAIRSADESNDFNAFHDGIVMIEKQFTGMLERKWKLTRFDSVGEEFDPQRHEAMMTDESAEVDKPTVTEDFQKGYMLADKVLRPSKVKVSMPTGDTPGQDST